MEADVIPLLINSNKIYPLEISVSSLSEITGRQPGVYRLQNIVYADTLLNDENSKAIYSKAFILN